MARLASFTHISSCRVYEPAHFSHSPLDNVAEVLVVDVVVLLPNRTLRTIFKLVLPMPVQMGSRPLITEKYKNDLHLN